MPKRAFILFILLIVVLALSARSPANAIGIMHDWIRNALPLMTLSLAAGLLISCSQIDIASGAAFSLAGMVVIDWMHRFGPNGMSLIYGCLVAWTTIVLFYCLMYLLVIFGRIPALLCTLGLAFCVQSGSLWLQSSLNGGSRTVPIDGAIRIFSWSSVWVPTVILLLILWRYFSDFGLHHIAIGLDVNAAQIAGVRTRTIYLTAFLMSGVLVGLSSILFLVSYQRGGWAADTGWGKELFAIAAAVFGGCRITGGRFDPGCVALATLLLVAVRDASSGLSMSIELEHLFLGVGVIVVALLDFSDTVWSTARPKSLGGGKRPIPLSQAVT